MKSPKQLRICVPACLLMLSILFTACAPVGSGNGGTATTESTPANQVEQDTPGDTSSGTTETTTKPESNENPPIEDNIGWEIGKLCPTADIAVMGEDTTAYAESYNIESNRQITVINFWYTQCVPCVEEMPHINQIATEYIGNVTVLALHADNGSGIAWILDSLKFIDENYFDSPIRFGFDHQNSYYQALGGTGTYPRTLVIDAEGKVAAIFTESITYDALKTAIDSLLEN